ncbi:hypothetical protein CYMTET_50151, partial [Cymbomonas tetramitiformis]
SLVLHLGKFISPEDSLTNVLPGVSSGAQEENYLELLSPLRTTTEAVSGATPGAICGHVALTGEVHSRAYVYSRDSAARAMACLKEDISSTLRIRLELLAEEEEAAAEEAVGTTGGVQFKDISLPRRIWLRWLDDVLLGDYLFQGDDAQVAFENRAALFGIEAMLPNNETIVFTEGEICPAANSKASWNPITNTSAQSPSSKTLQTCSKQGSEPANSWKAITGLALLVALLALLLFGSQGL